MARSGPHSGGAWLAIALVLATASSLSGVRADVRAGDALPSYSRRSLQVSQESGAGLMAAWREWKAMQGRAYGDEQSESKALDAFKQNMHLVQQIVGTNKPVNMSDYKFADMTWEDFQKRYLSSMTNVSVPKSWSATNGTSSSSSSSAVAVVHGGSALRSGGAGDATKRRSLYEGPLQSGGYLNWADVRKYRTPVRDQGSCGACWAFAAVHAVEYAYSIQLDRMGLIQSGYKAAQFSVQQLLECFTDGQGGCGWGSAAEFYNQLTRKQLVTEPFYPLVSNKNGGATGGCNGGAVSAGVSANNDIQYLPTVLGYVRLEGAGRDAIKQQLTISPVVCHFEVDVQFMTWNAQQTPVYTAGSCSGNNLNHAITVVGYDERSNPPAWIIKNSWGTGWGGLRGYARIAMTDGDGTCGMYKWCFRPDTGFESSSAVTYADDGASDGLFDVNAGGASATVSPSPPPPRPPRPPRPPPRRRLKPPPPSRRMAL